MRLVLCILLCLLSSCMVGPRYSRPCLPIQLEWTHAPADKEDFAFDDDPQWWSIFEDETLSKLIHYAYHQNRELEISGIQVYQAYSSLAITYGNFFPQIQQFQATHTRDRISETAAVNPGVTTFNNYLVDFFFTWELDLWGKFRHGIAASKADVCGAIYTYRDVFRSLAGTIGRLYMQIIGYNEKIKYLEQNVKIQERTVRIVRSKHTLGQTTALDLEQAISVYENTKGTLEQQVLQKKLAENFLCTLLGVAPFEVKDCYEIPNHVPEAPPHPEVGIPLNIIRSRPDIRAAEQLSIAQSHIVGIAVSEMLPAFSLEGFFGWESAIRDELFDPSSQRSRFGQNLLWDIFNYGRLSNNVRFQNAKLQELLVNYQNIVILACREVEDSMASYVQNKKIIDHFERSVNATQRTVDISMIQYEYGSVDFLNVLTAQENLVAQQITLVDAKVDHVNDYIDIQVSLGKGWEFTECKDYVSPCMKKRIGKNNFLW